MATELERATNDLRSVSIQGSAAETFAAAERVRQLQNPVNTSGVDPLDLRVIVRPDPPETKIGSIILPDSETERNKWAMTKGTLIAVGANAFAEARRNPSFAAPAPGTRVMFGKYAGSNFKGADGADYTIMNDEDITGVLIGE